MPDKEIRNIDDPLIKVSDIIFQYQREKILKGENLTLLLAVV